MFRFFSLLLPALLMVVCTCAQTAPDTTITSVPDTLPAGVDTTRADTATRRDSLAGLLPGDIVSRRPLFSEGWVPDAGTPFYRQVLQRHPFFDFNTAAAAVRPDIRKREGKDLLFYVLTGMLLLFALLRQAFGKYFSDLFRVFFRTTLKQKQIREQLMQNQLPSLLLNIFFVASAGLYINFLFHRFGPVPVGDFWLMYLYCCAALCIIYTGKYVALKVAGWLFSMSQAAAAYIFIVLIINKVIGIFLLPVLAVLAFAGEPLYSAGLVISWCGIGGLLLYRFVLGYAAIRNEVRFNPFHFFLYLCAFELAPLLVIYKLLIVVFR
ncbi:MAG: DUF4271 domain-containing protein [Chitinophagaceae bacterium]